MKIEILGSGCSKCKQLTANAETAVKELNLKAEITKITDIGKMADYGVMMTPALVVNGTIKVSGKVPSIPEIKAILQQAAA